MIQRLYRSLASAKLTLFLFLILAVTSIFGTIVPQGLLRERYEEIYGPWPAALIDFFQIFDLYHSWWFTGLLLLLAVNVTACTARQIPRLFRQLLQKTEHGDDGIFRTAPIGRRYMSGSPVDEMRQQARILMRSLAGEPVETARDDRTYFYAERGRYTRLGTAAIHVSILLILAGGLMGSIWGFGGQMTIKEGTTSETVELYDGGTRKLPFAVACDDFSVSFYENGMPREYRSDVTIMERGKKVHSATIRVNQPLKYGGLKFCQATYGIAEASNFKVVATNSVTGGKTPLALELMRKTPLPDGKAAFAAARFTADFQGRGPALLAVLLRPEKPHDIFWLFLNNTEETNKNHGEYTFEFKDFTPLFYTGIQIGKDPGVPLVWAGFILIMIGFILNLFGAHRRIWIRITFSAGDSEIIIAADAGKRKGDFEKRLDEKCRATFIV